MLNYLNIFIFKFNKHISKNFLLHTLDFKYNLSFDKLFNCSYNQFFC